MRLGAMLLVLLGLLAAWLEDARLKRWPTPGYALLGEALLVTEDWPGFWQELLATPAGKDVSQALSRQVHELERDVRLASGVRPTPTRWSVWLGDRIVLSIDGDRWLACVRPGLLYRGYRAALSTLGTLPPPVDGLDQFGDVFAAEHEGFLLVANTPWRRDDLQPAPELPPADLNPTLGVTLGTKTPSTQLHLTLHARSGIPFEMECARTSPANRQPFARPRRKTDNADPPLVDIAIENIDDYQGLSLWPVIAPHLSDAPGELWSMLFTPHLPKNLAPKILGNQYAARFALFDLPSSAGELLPHAGVSLMRRDAPWSQHPLFSDSIRPPLTRVPYTWGDAEGFLLPILGEDFTYACVTQGPWAHWANPPRHLAALLLEDAPAAATGPALEAHVDWAGLAAAFEAHLRDMQRLGRLEGDPRAFEVDYGCWTQALAALGRAELASVDNAAPDTLVLRGRLAARELTP